MTKNPWSNIYLNPDVFKEFKSTKVVFHWIEMKSNTDKVQALLKMYKENK